jgi:hypothetical protein
MKPLPATFVTKDQFHEEKIPGAFYIGDVDSDGETSFWYRCPCGCAVPGLLNVGKNFKPADGPSWIWNGSTEKPTLEPSVHHVGHWHGWLKNGMWTNA